MSQHIVTSFEDDLQGLSRSIAEMGGRAEQIVELGLAVGGVEAERRLAVQSPEAKQMPFVHQLRCGGRFGTRALLDLGGGRSVGDGDLELDQELDAHGFDVIFTPAAETTHHAPPKCTMPWPLTSPDFLSWMK